ncbi:hypothetical protein Hanom_Chr02g00176191 [Helianthus anomalus]
MIFIHFSPIRDASILILTIVAKLDPFPNDGGSKTYIPKNFYTKTTYITLLSEKFGGSGSPPRPFYTSPLNN